MKKPATDQISVYHYLMSREVPFDDKEFYTNMLVQDIHLSIMPRDVSRQSKFQCTIVPRNLTFENGIIQLLPSEYGKGHGLADGISKAVTFIAREIGFHGVAVFELVRYTEEEPLHFELVPLFPETFRVKGDKVLQVIPSELQDTMGIPKAVAIPKDKCFLFEFPEELGEASRYLKMLESLSSARSNKYELDLMLSFQQGTLPSYDFSHHQRIIESRTWSITRDIGWHHRDSLTNKGFANEHYRFGRRFRFRISQMLIRDKIIEQLKTMVRAIGQRCGIDAKLEIVGLQPVDWYQDGYNKWMAGDLTFAQTTEYLLYEQ